MLLADAEAGAEKPVRRSRCGSGQCGCVIKLKQNPTVKMKSDILLTQTELSIFLEIIVPSFSEIF